MIGFMRDLEPVGFRSQPTLTIDYISDLPGIATPRHLLEDVIQLIDLFKLAEVAP